MPVGRAVLCTPVVLPMRRARSARPTGRQASWWPVARCRFPLTLGRDFLKTLCHKKDLNPGHGKESPLSVVSSPFQNCGTGSTTEGTKGNIHVFSDSAQTSPVSHCPGGLWAFTSASSRSAAGRVLSQLHDRGRMQRALQSLTTDAVNTAVGWRSLFSNSTASFNTAIGAGALLLNNADNNTAVGVAALLLNTNGESNVAVRNWCAPF